MVALALHLVPGRERDHAHAGRPRLEDRDLARRPPHRPRPLRPRGGRARYGPAASACWSCTATPATPGRWTGTPAIRTCWCPAATTPPWRLWHARSGDLLATIEAIEEGALSWARFGPEGGHRGRLRPQRRGGDLGPDLLRPPHRGATWPSSSTACPAGRGATPRASASRPGRGRCSPVPWPRFAPRPPRDPSPSPR